MADRDLRHILQQQWDPVLGGQHDVFDLVDGHRPSQPMDEDHISSSIDTAPPDVRVIVTNSLDHLIE